jgi:hypothetical protein
LKCIPETPCFTFFERKPDIGEIVSLIKGDGLPESIKHWALYLGEDLFLSKFGKSSGNTDAHIAVMDITGMHKLYNADYIFTATPSEDAPKWDGTFRRNEIKT